MVVEKLKVPPPLSWKTRKSGMASATVTPTVGEKFKAPLLVPLPVVLPARLPVVLKMGQSPETKQHGFGYSTKERWEEMQKMLIGMDLMPAPVDVSKVATNEFLK